SGGRRRLGGGDPRVREDVVAQRCNGGGHGGRLLEKVAPGDLEGRVNTETHDPLLSAAAPPCEPQPAPYRRTRRDPAAPAAAAVWSPPPGTVKPDGPLAEPLFPRGAASWRVGSSGVSQHRQVLVRGVDPRTARECRIERPLALEELLTVVEPPFEA